MQIKKDVHFMRSILFGTFWNLILEVAIHFASTFNLNFLTLFSL